MAYFRIFLVGILLPCFFFASALADSTSGNEYTHQSTDVLYLIAARTTTSGQHPTQADIHRVAISYQYNDTSTDGPVTGGFPPIHAVLHDTRVTTISLYDLIPQSMAVSASFIYWTDASLRHPSISRILKPAASTVSYASSDATASHFITFNPYTKISALAYMDNFLYWAINDTVYCRPESTTTVYTSSNPQQWMNLTALTNSPSRFGLQPVQPDGAPFETTEPVLIRSIWADPIDKTVTLAASNGTHGIMLQCAPFFNSTVQRQQFIVLSFSASPVQVANAAVDLDAAPGYGAMVGSSVPGVYFGCDTAGRNDIHVFSPLNPAGKSSTIGCGRVPHTLAAAPGASVASRDAFSVRPTEPTETSSTTFSMRGPKSASTSTTSSVWIEGQKKEVSIWQTKETGMQKQPKRSRSNKEPAYTMYMVTSTRQNNQELPVIALMDFPPYQKGIEEVPLFVATGATAWIAPITNDLYSSTSWIAPITNDLYSSTSLDN